MSIRQALRRLPYFATQKHSKVTMRHFPAPAGQPEMMRKNSMRSSIFQFSGMQYCAWSFIFPNIFFRP